ncbi:MAG: UDP binding domain-containing protein, partial [bacterium]
LKGARVLVLGIAYKKDVDDPRESPSFKVIELYQSKGAVVDYNDPYVPELPKMRHHALSMKSVPLTEHTVSSYDAVVIVTDHSDYDYKWLYSVAKLIIDTRNALRVSLKDEKVVKA